MTNRLGGLLELGSLGQSLTDELMRQRLANWKEDVDVSKRPHLPHGLVCEGKIRI